MKSDKMTEIECRLADCIFYEGPSATPNKIHCSHKDAPRYVYADPPCPLYRLDWQKKMASAPSPAASPKPGFRKRF